MEVEHIVPRSGGGGNKVSNLPLSCRPCNEKTDNQTTTEFGYPEVQAKLSVHYEMQQRVRI